MPRRPHLTHAAAICGVLALGGCGFGPVEVEPHDLEPGSSEVCAALVEELPEVVDDAVQRDLDPSSEAAAAWGQPAIVLRCGVPMPAAYRPDSQLYEVDGVGWLAEDGDGGMFFTAADREVLVEVSVPDDYAPEADVLVDLAPSILATIPERALR